MEQQEHLFVNKDRTNHDIWTMEDAIESGIPIDVESGDDMEYIGPVSLRIGDICIVVEQLGSVYVVNQKTGHIQMHGFEFLMQS